MITSAMGSAVGGLLNKQEDCSTRKGKIKVWVQVIICIDRSLCQVLVW